MLDELAAEQEALDARVAGLTEAEWAIPTPAEGWDVRDSIGHLGYFEETANLALTDRDAFSRHSAELGSGRLVHPDEVLSRSLPGDEVLQRWRVSRAALLSSLRAADPAARVPWYGPAMSVTSFATARVMETWAHGQDVADALGAPPVVSDRLRHVGHIGMAARPYAFLVNQLEDPGDPVRVVVRGPGGDVWTWGPDGSENRVEGTALDFALVVTQRRHLDDTALVVTGPVARQWLSIAQSFAGPRGPGRQPGLGHVAQDGQG